MDRYETLSKMKAIVVGRLLDYLDQPTTKMGVGGPPPALDALQLRLRVRFGDRIIAVKTWPFFLEITNPTATKARALEILGRLLGFEARDVLAFGDSYNDADMLAWAGTGVAMADAPAEVAPEKDGGALLLVDPRYYGEWADGLDWANAADAALLNGVILGQAIGRGERLADVVARIASVAEGVSTAASARGLNTRRSSAPSSEAAPKSGPAPAMTR